MRARLPLKLIAALALALPGLVRAVEPPVAPVAPFQLQAQLVPAAPVRGNGRFSLSASLTPAPAGVGPSLERFVASARLQPTAKAGVCSAPGRIFGDGFENP